jgi:lysyl-tRNA synthetase, class II
MSDPTDGAAPTSATTQPHSEPDGVQDVHRLVKVRLDKVARIRALGFDPYANDFKPEISSSAFRARYEDMSTEQLAAAGTVHTLAGRVIAMRQMGKASFLTLRDAYGDIQAFIKLDRVGVAYELLKLIDLGDFVGVAGTAMRTKTNELTVAADGLRVLTKAIHPLPDKFHGLTDVEQRYRQRYVDLATNLDVRRVFRQRSKIVRSIQRLLDGRDFIEVETPILQDIAGGAAAKPFTTHHNALDQQLYLRIATELHLKRLVVGGLERVFEMGRNFRNEGVSTRHNPEFTSIEVYQSYATFLDMMDLTEDMIVGASHELHGSTTTIQYGEQQIQLQRPWRRVPIATLVGEHLGQPGDLANLDSVAVAMRLSVGHTASPDEPLHIVLKCLSDEEADRIIPGIVAGPASTLVARSKAAMVAGGGGFFAALGRAVDAAFATVASETRGAEEITQPGRPADDTAEEMHRPIDLRRARRRDIALSLLYAVFDHEVERTIIDPVFITDFPLSVSPLARCRDGDPAVTDRFELIIGGMEIANAFSELNDPMDQRARLEAQLRQRERGDEEAHGLDEDFCHALEIGMPPTAGLGIGIDRVVMLLSNQTSIRDVVLFPQMRRASS